MLVFLSAPVPFLDKRSAARMRWEVWLVGWLIISTSN